ncbi:MAG TPA: peptidoglycan-associated lipoprotein Pal [Thermoanaerobaculaceae bacterium]|nr:peptidoglycan-associated lipoprotein Pal [Acidobacteriota bacterium]NLH11778.1 peptidoglycan-associated lipoprotein Pal [Holophagae bacterium]HPW56889.1 peptidoglycan-associated lipoprotein Pal [Thermoanaerobaculaceae bacterium]
MPRAKGIVGLLLAVLVLATACSTRKPRVTPDIPRPEASADESTSAAGSGTTVVHAEPAIGAAGTPELGVSASDLPTDLQELNRAGYLKDVFFDTNKADLRDDARDILAANTAWLKQHPNVRVQLEGHCDERNTEEYNLALGWRRVFAVKDYLVSLGVDAARLGVISYGEERPFATGHDESAWSQNRRVHIVITGR